MRVWLTTIAPFETPGSSPKRGFSCRRVIHPIHSFKTDPKHTKKFLTKNMGTAVLNGARGSKLSSQNMGTSVISDKRGMISAAREGEASRRGQTIDKTDSFLPCSSKRAPLRAYKRTAETGLPACRSQEKRLILTKNAGDLPELRGKTRRIAPPPLYQNAKVKPECGVTSIILSEASGCNTPGSGLGVLS